MQEVFMVAEFDSQGNIRVLATERFTTYQEAVDYIKESPNGTYQVQKVFVVSDKAEW